MKKYRIRKLSLAWWVTRIGGTILALAGWYACIILANAFIIITQN